MNHKLSDIDRTLLSAYLDGELSGADLAKAERLLAASDDARAYLKDMRLVDSLSSAVLAAPIISGGPLGATKLTGSAIEMAAGKAVVAKAVTMGTWGLAGVITTAAAVVVGIALSVQSPKPAGEHLAKKSQKREAMAPAPEAVAEPMVNLDTSDLIVPPMTPSDIVAFAVHGTLPIDSKREKFITFEPKGGNSLAVQVHGDAPEDFVDEFDDWSLAETQGLDSIQRVIRTSLVRLSKEGIALREDIPSLRLDVISSIERCTERLPAELRSRLDRTRSELASMKSYARSTARSDHHVQVRGRGETPQVHYRVLTIGDDIVDGGAFATSEGGFVVNFGAEPAIMIDQRSLCSLQSTIQIPMPRMPVPSTFAVVAPRAQGSASGSAAGERPVRRRFRQQVPVPPPPHHVGFSGVEEEIEELIQMGQEGGFPVSIFDLQVRTNDTLVFNAHRSLRKAEEALRRADSIFKDLQMRNSQRQKEWEERARRSERERKELHQQWELDTRSNGNDLQQQVGGVDNQNHDPADPE